MNERVLGILRELCPKIPAISELSNLKSDLRMDSMSLVQLAVRIDEEFGVDLGEAADQGKTFETVKDIIQCLEK